MNYFVGFDKRYVKDFEVCVRSLNRSVEKTPNELIYRYQDGSTEFTYSRFLIPYISNYTGWSLYCDSDFIFLSDVEELNLLKNENFAVFVCKHPEYIPKTKTKMNGQLQTTYRRKNWSSLILWNNAHKKNKILTPEFVNNIDPSTLHQFKWLSDNLIGEIPLEWNTLVGYYDFVSPKALHYTDGTENMILSKNA